MKVTTNNTLGYAVTCYYVRRTRMAGSHSTCCSPTPTLYLTYARQPSPSRRQAWSQPGHARRRGALGRGGSTKRMRDCSCDPPAPRHERKGVGQGGPGVVRLACATVTISLREVIEDNAQAVLALRTTPDQERFVSTVAYSLTEAAENPQGNPWYRAVYAGDRPVGFVMLSWDVEPQPPDINGPWFLWKLLIDHRYQRQGYGQAVVRHIVELVRDQGATELLTSYVPGEGGPASFYARLGFVPTGELDPSGEIILRRPVHE